MSCNETLIHSQTVSDGQLKSTLVLIFTTDNSKDAKMSTILTLSQIIFIETAFAAISLLYGQNTGSTSNAESSYHTFYN